MLLSEFHSSPPDLCALIILHGVKPTVLLTLSCMSMLAPACARSGINCTLPTLIVTVSAEPPLCVKENIKYDVDPDVVYFTQCMLMHVAHNHKFFFNVGSSLELQGG